MAPAVLDTQTYRRRRKEAAIGTSMCLGGECLVVYAMVNFGVRYCLRTGPGMGFGQREPRGGGVRQSDLGSTVWVRDRYSFSDFTFDCDLTIKN
jgi:hypothetical protein